MTEYKKYLRWYKAFQKERCKQHSLARRKQERWVKRMIGLSGSVNTWSRQVIVDGAFDSMTEAISELKRIMKHMKGRRMACFYQLSDGLIFFKNKNKKFCIRPLKR